MLSLSEVLVRRQNVLAHDGVHRLLLRCRPHEEHPRYEGEGRCSEPCYQCMVRDASRHVLFPYCWGGAYRLPPSEDDAASLTRGNIEGFNDRSQPLPGRGTTGGLRFFKDLDDIRAVIAALRANVRCPGSVDAALGHRPSFVRIIARWSVSVSRSFSSDFLST
jgi:hypothetical protein